MAGRWGGPTALVCALWRRAELSWRYLPELKHRRIPRVGDDLGLTSRFDGWWLTRPSLAWTRRMGLGTLWVLQVGSSNITERLLFTLLGSETTPFWAVPL